jgi:hypothetical protein
VFSTPNRGLCPVRLIHPSLGSALPVRFHPQKPPRPSCRLPPIAGTHPAPLLGTPHKSLAVAVGSPPPTWGVLSYPANSPHTGVSSHGLCFYTRFILATTADPPAHPTAITVWGPATPRGLCPIRTPRCWFAVAVSPHPALHPTPPGAPPALSHPDGSPHRVGQCHFRVTPMA